jgi:hypothetical protein
MSPIIHMQTEQARELARYLCVIADQMSDSVLALRAELYRMDWLGTRRDEFLAEAEHCLRALYSLLEDLDRLGIKVNRESEQWEEVAARFAG